MPRPKTIWSYSADIVSADYIKTLDQRIDQVTSLELYTHLKNARDHEVPITLYDRWGVEHDCYDTSFEWLPRSMAPGAYNDPKELEGIIRATFIEVTFNDS
jgi:hypothetical protein